MRWNFYSYYSGSHFYSCRKSSSRGTVAGKDHTEFIGMTILPYRYQTGSGVLKQCCCGEFWQIRNGFSSWNGSIRCTKLFCQKVSFPAVLSAWQNKSKVHTKKSLYRFPVTKNGSVFCNSCFERLSGIYLMRWNHWKNSVPFIFPAHFIAAKQSTGIAYSIVFYFSSVNVKCLILKQKCLKKIQNALKS